MRKIAVLLAIAATTVTTVATGALIFLGGTQSGRQTLERITYLLSGGRVQIAGLGGGFPQRLSARAVILRDREGIWLVANDVALHWRPIGVLERHIEVADLRVASIDLRRRPAATSGGSHAPTIFTTIELRHASISRLRLAAPLAGHEASLAVDGELRWQWGGLLDLRADARRLDAAGSYQLRWKGDARRIDARIVLREPPEGPLENLLGLPNLGGLSASLSLSGPSDAAGVELRLAAGTLHATASGTADLRRGSADLHTAGQSTAMSPRADLAWRGCEWSGRWRGTLNDARVSATLAIDGLRLPGGVEIRRLQAALGGQDGAYSLHGSADAVRLSARAGAGGDVLAHAPVEFAAAYSTKSPRQGLRIEAHHPLVSVTARLDPQAAVAANMHFVVAQIAPFAAIAGRHVEGRAEADIALTRLASPLDLRANVRFTGLSANDAWVASLGHEVAVSLAARLARADPGAAAIGRWQARLTVDAADLGAGTASAAGHARVVGEFEGFGAGLRGLQGGDLRLTGRLDAAPLAAAASLRRTPHGFAARIRGGSWKSVAAAGRFGFDGSGRLEEAQASLTVADLADLDRIVDADLHGRLQSDASWRIAGRRPQIEWRTILQRFESGATAVDADALLAGAPDALVLRLDAHGRVRGAEVAMSALGGVDPQRRRIHLREASLRYAGRKLRLLAPADVDFAAGLRSSELRFDLGRGSLMVRGQFAPTLDVQAELRDGDARLVDLFAPGWLARGRIDAQARLAGPYGAPYGSLQWNATGLRGVDADGLGLPEVSLRGSARLDSHVLQLRADLQAAHKAQLRIDGRVPLEGAVPLALRADGSIDLALAAPTLEARGIHASGLVRVALEVSGSFAKPQLSGELRMTDGQVRDFVRGVNLQHIEATLAGDGDSLNVSHFAATTGSGRVTVTGRIGVLAAQKPLDLHIQASNARLIASSLVTATVDGDVTVRGEASKRIELAGRIHVRRAIIGIPNALPPNVAVLDVRRRGTPPAVAAPQPLVVALDLTVEAPRQVLVQGRGLDAELGGDLRLGGTLDSPQVSGGFDLQRGSFTLAGSRLSFTSGHVGFNGAGLRQRIDPTLDFTAQSSYSNVQSTLRITGLADAPRFELTSIPQLPPDQILGNLLFGGTSPARLTALQAAQIGAALATLSGVGGAGLDPLAALQRALGLDRLTVGAASPTTNATAAAPAGASIAAGRYLSPRVYLEAKQSTTGFSQLQVDVDLTRHLKLRTRFGNGAAITQGITPQNDPGNSIGLSYQFEY
ncbi:MAG: translocation/assembly module TamB domain-containing protein [Gammaproteobacteria bacterium]|nr:translocation/assembly module TamB domain-containing protein [Gammaproteobacteria bacterium]